VWRAPHKAPDGCNQLLAERVAPTEQQEFALVGRFDVAPEPRQQIPQWRLRLLQHQQKSSRRYRQIPLSRLSELPNLTTHAQLRKESNGRKLFDMSSWPHRPLLHLIWLNPQCSKYKTSNHSG
jgi:hypothetical protein